VCAAAWAAGLSSPWHAPPYSLLSHRFVDPADKDMKELAMLDVQLPPGLWLLELNSVMSLHPFCAAVLPERTAYAGCITLQAALTA